MGQSKPSIESIGDGVATEGRPSRRLGTYLKRLREGYGYTLRKVEEKAMALGEVIDNSQLSRFEKGKALPSFEKLRALARIFNVSVQNFSDVLDLEEYEVYRPESDDFGELLRIGQDLFARGESGRAFVAFEKALERAEGERESGEAAFERIAEARWRMAAALKALGKLGMTESELREILRLRGRTGRRIQIRALLHLSYVYREMSDAYLAEVLARESLDLAIEEGDLGVQAGVLNTLGNLHEEENADQALPYYERSLEILMPLGSQEEMLLTVMTNLGGCLAKLHRFDEGITRIQEARTRARERGFRRIAALADTRLAEAWLLRGSRDHALRCLDESDTLASHPHAPQNDILFLNAFHRWKLARGEGHGTREKIAFGRLRHLRSLLERRFPEVEAFDLYVERNRRRQHEYAS